MHRGVVSYRKQIARLCFAATLLAAAAGSAFAQDDALTATKRLFPGIGAGLHAVRRGANGRYYVLVSPALGVAVFDAEGKPLLEIGTQPIAQGAGTKPQPAIVFGEDCDVDAEGRIYVADHGANAVKIFSSKGELLRAIHVPEPISVAALSGGEVAVSTLREPKLVYVYSAEGREVRAFGEPADIANRSDLNRFLNIGRLAHDAQDHIYYAFRYLPEPTVRQYDSHGYAGYEIQLTEVDFLTGARAVRREIARQEQRGDSPSLKPVVTAVGVDPTSGEVWMAMGNTLLRFDREGNHRASYRIYTAEGARLEATTLFVEPLRLLIGSDPLGIYEFERPDKRGTQ
jgi:hypothetical protein